MNKIKVGIIGVGNCASALFQGIEYYNRNPKQETIGLMHKKVGKYNFSDLEAVSAWDIGKNKVNKPIEDAYKADPNYVNWVDLKKSGVIVSEAPVLDTLTKYTVGMFDPIEQQKSDYKKIEDEIKNEIERTGVDVLINYLPVGSVEATRFWAEIAISTGTGFVNCIPEFIASDKVWEDRFKDAKVPICGDDIKSQIGATILHRVLMKICADRGGVIDKTYQLNVGGNTDFANMLDRDRLKSKEISKTEAVQSQLNERLPDNMIHIGPSDFIPFLGNTKLAFMRIEGRMFANIPFNLEIRLDVDDKANSGGTAIDAIRCVKLALENNIGGTIVGPSAYLMKHPPIQYSDSEAKELTDKFISDNS